MKSSLWSTMRTKKVRLWTLLAIFGVLIAVVGGITTAAIRTTKAAAPPDVTYNDPLTITQGGTYSGNWRSTDPKVPAVSIQTKDPVIIQNATIVGPGKLIDAEQGGANLTILNSSGFALNPNITGQLKGDFLNIYQATKVDVEHCSIDGAANGIFVNGYGGNRSSDQTVTIRDNAFHNTDGRHSDGNGGYQATGDSGVPHSIILDQVQNVPGIDIAWNQFINDPRDSYVTDVINIYSSSGTASSHLLVHDNYIHGSYPPDPTKDSFSGGGIIADGSSGDKADTTTTLLDIYSNQIVSTTNYGIALEGGHDNVAHDNRVVSSGVLADGSSLAGQNVGLVIWNFYKQPFGDVFANNVIRDNTVGWVNKKNGGRNDSWLPDCAQNGCTNNQALPDPITLDTESAEYTSWQQKLSTAGITVGPATTGTGATGKALFASGLEAGEPQVTASDTVVDSGGYAGGQANVSGVCCKLAGPEMGVRTEVAHTGSNALMYSGNVVTTDAGRYAYMKAFDLSGSAPTIGQNTTLSYWVYPQSQTSFTSIGGSNSTCVALDLILGDSTNLRDSGVTDQNGVKLHPASQCGHLTLDTWNHVTAKLGMLAGKTIAHINVGFDNGPDVGGYRGYIDDITITN